jgi:glycosyltransferase involved in cell wall biosynthesis
VRVVQICNELAFYGAENVAMQIARSTREPDIEMAVMTVSRWSHPELRASIEVPVLMIDRHGRRDVGFIARMVGSLRGIRADVVNTHGHHGRYWGRLAALLAGVPVIVHSEHNPVLLRPRPQVAYWALDGMMKRRTTFVDVTGRRRGEIAAAEGIAPERIIAIPNGVALRPVVDGVRDRVRAELAIPPDGTAILILARLYAQKRIDRAIDALAALDAPLRERSYLIVAGDGPLRDPLGAQAAERGISLQVRFLGFRSDTAELLAAADVALLTSAHEALPLAMIEAMLARVPVVSTPWDGAPMLLGDGRRGRIAASHTPQAIADALRDTIEDRIGALARAENAYRYARHEFAIETQVRSYVELYRELHARSRRR